MWLNDLLRLIWLSSLGETFKHKFLLVQIAFCLFRNFNQRFLARPKGVILELSRRVRDFRRNQAVLRNIKEPPSLNFWPLIYGLFLLFNWFKINSVGVSKVKLKHSSHFLVALLSCILWNLAFRVRLKWLHGPLHILVARLLFDQVVRLIRPWLFDLQQLKAKTFHHVLCVFLYWLLLLSLFILNWFLFLLRLFDLVGDFFFFKDALVVLRNVVDTTAATIFVLAFIWSWVGIHLDVHRLVQPWFYPLYFFTLHLLLILLISLCFFLSDTHPFKEFNVFVFKLAVTVLAILRRI